MFSRDQNTPEGGSTRRFTSNDEIKQYARNTKRVDPVQLNEAEAKKAIEGIKKLCEYKIGKSIQTPAVVCALCTLFQQGGTHAKCRGSLEVNVQGIIISLSDVRRVLKDVGLENKERKLARTLATDCYEVGKCLDICGNLYTKFLREQNYDLEDDDKYWLSEFQAHNPDCPEHIRAKILSLGKKARRKSSVKKKKK